MKFEDYGFDRLWISSIGLSATLTRNISYMREFDLTTPVYALGIYNGRDINLTMTLDRKSGDVTICLLPSNGISRQDIIGKLQVFLSSSLKVKWMDCKNYSITV